MIKRFVYDEVPVLFHLILHSLNVVLYLYCRIVIIKTVKNQ